jgi:hypothetical protein
MISWAIRVKARLILSSSMIRLFSANRIPFASSVPGIKKHLPQPVQESTAIACNIHHDFLSASLGPIKGKPLSFLSLPYHPAPVKRVSYISLPKLKENLSYTLQLGSQALVPY